MIEVNGLVKKYGSKIAVNNISFTVKEGEIVGFLGPNGAGKSTTMNMITGYISATEGTIKVNGLDVFEEGEEVRRKIGYLPEQPPLYMDFTIDEYLNYAYELKKARQSKKEHLDKICEMTGISHVRSRVIKNLSKGFKQRVGLAQALVGDPDVLILDEPTVGLDPLQIIEIRNVIKELGKERTIILSSHILPEVQAICERVLVINTGVIVADGTPEHLSAMLTGNSKLQYRILGDSHKVISLLTSVNGITKVMPIGEKEPGTMDYIVETSPGEDSRQAIFSVLAQNSFPIYIMKPIDLSLEDIFLKLTTEEKIITA